MPKKDLILCRDCVFCLFESGYFCVRLEPPEITSEIDYATGVKFKTIPWYFKLSIMCQAERSAPQVCGPEARYFSRLPAGNSLPVIIR